MQAQTDAMNNANNAYKNAGMSANEYMETVSSFAASLKQSVDNEVEAAKAADLAVIDMADNANKMGTNMESIKNAYQGFAKQNYTMLDNLKLGYGGTKEEMQRLLADAERLSGVHYDISNLADVYSAIHVIQTELGITGTTAKEATETLSGSFSALGSTWNNLLTGIADDNANFDQLIDNFVDSALVVADNLLPRVEVALAGIGQLIEELLPIIVERIPEIVDTVLPDLLESGANMLFTICQGIIESLPALGETAFELIEKLVSGINDNAGSVFNSGSETLLGFIEGIADALPDLFNMAAEAIVSMALALTEPDTLNNIIEAGIELITSLIAGITEALPKLLEAAPTILANLATAIITSIPRLLVAATEIVFRLAGFLIDALVQWKNLGNNFMDALETSFEKVDWMSLGINIIDGIWNGLRKGWDWLVGKVEKLADDLFDSACSVLGIHSPSKKFEWVADMCIAGLDEPLEDYNPFDTLQHSMKANIGGLQATFTRTALATAGGPAMDYVAMGNELKGAINGAAVYLNGEKVGQLITPTVNDELADYTDRRI